MEVRRQRLGRCYRQPMGAPGGTAERSPCDGSRADNGLGLAGRLLADATGLRRSIKIISERCASPRGGYSMSWSAPSKTGAMGMPGFVYLFVDEADRADPANRREFMRMLRRACKGPGGSCARVFVSIAGTHCRCRRS